MEDVQRSLRSVSSGTHLRIERVSSGRAEGTLQERYADAITIGNGDVLERIAFVDITRVWRRATFAFPGALIGGVAGLAFGAMIGLQILSFLPGFVAAFFTGKALIVAALVLTGLGALLGAALGAAFPRWVKIWG